MRNIELVKKREILNRRSERNEKKKGKEGKVLGKKRIEIVRNGRRKIMERREELLRLKKLSEMNMENLDGDVLNRGWNEEESWEKNGVEVERDKMCRKGIWLKEEIGEEILLKERVDIGESEEGKRDWESGDLRERGKEKGEIERNLGIEKRESEENSGRLGMNEVDEEDEKSVIVIERKFIKGLKKEVKIREKKVGREKKMEIESGVEKVRWSNEMMEEKDVREDKLGKMSEEWDKVMIGEGLDLVDEGEVEFRKDEILKDGNGRLIRDEEKLRKRIEGIGLDIEKDEEISLGRKDGENLWKGIERDNGWIMWKVRV